MIKTHPDKIKQDSPHQAIILIRIEIMEQLKTGLVDGKPVMVDSTLTTIIGKNFKDCELKTKQFIKSIKETANLINRTKT